MTEEQIVLTEAQKKLLENLMQQYSEVSDEFDVIEARKKSLNAMIKQLLEDYKVSKFSSKETGLSVSMSKRPNISWKEDDLISYCESTNVPGLIKTKKYVDMEALESAIYTGKVLAESLKPFQVVKPDTVTLRLTQKKPLKE